MSKKAEKLSKTSLSDRLCDILDVEVDFTKMTKEDLVLLHKRVNELNKLTEGIDEKLLSKEMLFSKPLEEILDTKIGGKPLRELSLGDIVHRMRAHGPLGLGIIPEIRAEVRRRLRGERQ